MDKFLKTCLPPTLNDNYLSKNDASTQVLYLGSAEKVRNQQDWG